MTVKELKELLSKADEKLNVVIFNGDNELKNIKDAGKSTFMGACDKKGNLLPYGNNPKYNIDVFILEV
jgi:hypothetical protein